jgi:hypothetical protein
MSGSRTKALRHYLYAQGWPPAWFRRLKHYWTRHHRLPTQEDL